MDLLDVRRRSNDRDDGGGGRGRGRGELFDRDDDDDDPDPDEEEEYGDEEEEEEDDDEEQEHGGGEDENDDEDESYEVLSADEFADYLLSSVPTVEVGKTFLATVEALTGCQVAQVIKTLQKQRNNGKGDEVGDDGGGRGGGGDAADMIAASDPMPSTQPRRAASTVESAAAAADDDDNGSDNAEDDDGQRSGKAVVEDLVIQLRFARHTLPVAQRVTRILNALGLDALESLAIHCDEDGARTGRLASRLVDHYLASLRGHPDGRSGGAARQRPRPMHVHLDCLGHDGDAWRTFADRYRSLERLSLGNQFLYLHNFTEWIVLAISDTLGSLSNLQSVKANLNAYASPDAVSSLCEGLLKAPKLEALDVQLDDDDPFEFEYDDDSDESDEGREPDLLESVNYLASLVATSKSLKTLCFRLSGKAESSDVDCLVLLDKAVDSATLEEVALCDLSLRASTEDPQRVTTNRSLRAVKLSRATLSPDVCALLPRFENLRSIHIDAPRTSQHRTSWAEMFRRLPNLESFSDASRHDHRIAHDQELAAIADNLDNLPLLQKLNLTTQASPTGGGSVEFPSIENLLRKSKGYLGLDHVGCGDDNANFLSAGISEALHLQHLDLRVTGLVLSTARFALILGGLERNRTLHTFKGIFEVSTPMVLGTLEPVLTSLLSANRTLRTFELDVHICGPNLCKSRSNLENALLESIGAGLVHNQSLENLKLFPFEATASFLNLLNKNTTLLAVEGNDAPAILWILTLNRYKRRLLQCPRELPEGVWTQVLERIATDQRQDVMFHFLKRLPSSILQRRRS